MYESRPHYAAIVRLQRVRLEARIGRPIHHLDRGVCPSCGEPGRFDIDGLGFSPLAGNSIYYSTVYDEWRCRLCDFRMCA